MTPTLSGSPLKYRGADSATMTIFCHQSPVVGRFERKATWTGFDPRAM
jgi:hypothetical protein